MRFGSKTSASPMVLGDIIKQCLSSFMNAYALHTHVGNLGFPTAPPDNAATVTALKADPIDNGAINSTKCFTE